MQKKDDGSMDDEEYKDVEILQTDYNGNIRDEVFAFSSQ